MTCEQARQWIVTSWLEPIPSESRAALEQHLRECPDCAEQEPVLSDLWDRLGALPAAEPSHRMAADFRRVHQAYEFGRRRTPGAMPMWTKAAAAAVLVAFGAASGHLYTARTQDAQRITALSAEVREMRQLVAVSMLRQSSAAERLRGVTYSREAGGGEVTDALFEALMSDPNVNVRLAALDALRQVASRTEAVRRMRSAVATQESPLVQMALIDWAVDEKESGSLKAFDRSKLDPAVAARLDAAFNHLQ